VQPKPNCLILVGMGGIPMDKAMSDLAASDMMAPSMAVPSARMKRRIIDNRN